MKPHARVIIHRTQNDTDLMSFVLQVATDAGIENVSDDDTVVMHIQAGGNVVSITGTPKGDSSGTFYFAPTDILVNTGSMPFELQVTRDSDGIVYTAATGTIKSTPELA